MTAEQKRLKAEMAAGKKQDRTSLWVHVFCTATTIGMLLPLVASYVPDDYTAFQNLVPPVKWLAVCLKAGLLISAITIVSFLIVIYCTERGLARRVYRAETLSPENKLKYEEGDDLVAGSLVRMGFANPRGWKSYYNILANTFCVLALWAAGCWTSGAIFAGLYIAAQVIFGIGRGMLNVWVGNLSDEDCRRLVLSRPWVEPVIVSGDAA